MTADQALKYSNCVCSVTIAGITRPLDIGRLRDAMSMIEISALGRSEDFVGEVDGRDESYFLGMVSIRHRVFLIGARTSLYCKGEMGHYRMKRYSRLDI